MLQPKRLRFFPSHLNVQAETEVTSRCCLIGMRFLPLFGITSRLAIDLNFLDSRTLFGAEKTFNRNDAYRVCHNRSDHHDTLPAVVAESP